MQLLLLVKTKILPKAVLAAQLGLVCFRWRIERRADWIGVQWPVTRKPARLVLESFASFLGVDDMDFGGCSCVFHLAHCVVLYKCICPLVDWTRRFGESGSLVCGLKASKSENFHAACLSVTPTRRLKGRSCYGFFAFLVLFLVS